MKTKTKLSITRPQINKEKAKEFIQGAKNNSPVVQQEQGELPWEAANVRDELLKPFNLRLPESYDFKLNFIAENGSKSKHAFLMNVIKPAIDAEVNKLITKPNE